MDGQISVGSMRRRRGGLAKRVRRARAWKSRMVCGGRGGAGCGDLVTRRGVDDGVDGGLRMREMTGAKMGGTGPYLNLIDTAGDALAPRLNLLPTLTRNPYGCVWVIWLRTVCVLYMRGLILRHSTITYRGVFLGSIWTSDHRWLSRRWCSDTAWRGVAGPFQYIPTLTTSNDSKANHTLSVGEGHYRWNATNANGGRKFVHRHKRSESAIVTDQEVARSR